MSARFIIRKTQPTGKKKFSRVIPTAIVASQPVSVVVEEKPVEVVLPEVAVEVVEESPVVKAQPKKKGKTSTTKKEKELVMAMNEENIQKLDTLMGANTNDEQGSVTIKQNDGLIEKTKSSRRVLVEDGTGRELLRD